MDSRAAHNDFEIILTFFFIKNNTQVHFDFPVLKKKSSSAWPNDRLKKLNSNPEKKTNFHSYIIERRNRMK